MTTDTIRLSGRLELALAPTVDSVPEARADGASLIAAERQRQIDAEGWTPEHDDEHTNGALAMAAAAYAVQGVPICPLSAGGWGLWPWAAEWWKPSDDPIKNLIRAGALIAAEIDRLARCGGVQ
jgi:hypothetical protein